MFVDAHLKFFCLFWPPSIRSAPILQKVGLMRVIILGLDFKKLLFSTLTKNWDGATFGTFHQLTDNVQSFVWHTGFIVGMTLVNDMWGRVETKVLNTNSTNFWPDHLCKIGAPLSSVKSNSS